MISSREPSSSMLNYYFLVCGISDIWRTRFPNFFSKFLEVAIDVDGFNVLENIREIQNILQYVQLLALVNSSNSRFNR